MAVRRAAVGMHDDLRRVPIPPLQLGRDVVEAMAQIRHEPHEHGQCIDRACQGRNQPSDELGEHGEHKVGGDGGIREALGPYFEAMLAPGGATTKTCTAASRSRLPGGRQSLSLQATGDPGAQSFDPLGTPDHRHVVPVPQRGGTARDDLLISAENEGDQRVRR